MTDDVASVMHRLSIPHVSAAHVHAMPRQSLPCGFRSVCIALPSSMHGSHSHTLWGPSGAPSGSSSLLPAKLKRACAARRALACCGWGNRHAMDMSRLRDGAPDRLCTLLHIHSLSALDTRCERYCVASINPSSSSAGKWAPLLEAPEADTAGAHVIRTLTAAAARISAAANCSSRVGLGSPEPGPLAATPPFPSPGTPPAPAAPSGSPSACCITSNNCLALCAHSQAHMALAVEQVL
jgi:hypothetical protein